MKVTIFDIKRFAVHDGPGIRTTVFLKGCPLRCWWCHNPESQEREPVRVEILRKVNGRCVPGIKVYGEEMEVDRLLETVLRDRHFYEESDGGVTFSGGEPMMQAEGLLWLLTGSKEHGLHTTVDTSGYASWELFERIFPWTDLFLYDLKHMDPELHRRFTSVDNGPILQNASRLLEKGANMIFRIPVIPGINTTEEEVAGMIAYVKERAERMNELHLLPYHRIAESKYRRLHMNQQLGEVDEPGESLMLRLKKQFEETGLEVILGG